MSNRKFNDNPSKLTTNTNFFFFDETNQHKVQTKTIIPKLLYYIWLEKIIISAQKDSHRIHVSVKKHSSKGCGKFGGQVTR